MTRTSPLFMVLTIIAGALTLFTPRLLIFFPLMCVFSFGVVSIFRKERERWCSVTIMGLVASLLIFSASDFGETSVSTPGRASGHESLNAAEIADWNWRVDRNFGTRGTIKWNVQVRNKSARHIESARVEFTTFDKANKLITTTFSYVKAITSGEVRSEASYADLYGSEDHATVRITSVRFAN